MSAVAARVANPSSCAGFTLVETLVALALLGLTSLLVFSALRLNSFVWVQTGARIQTSTDILTAQALLRDTITHAYPALLRRKDNAAIVSFRGTRKELELSAPLPFGAAVGGYHRVWFWLRSAPSATPYLTMSWRLERNTYERQDLPQPEQQVDLLPDIRSLEFAYYGTLRGNQNPAWYSDWQDQMALPELVRVSAKFAATHPEWPTLVVAPLAQVDASCVLDLLTRTCRGR